MGSRQIIIRPMKSKRQNKMKNMRIFLLAITVFLGLFGFSQEPDTLTWESYTELVKKHHPLAIQARLKPVEGEAYLRYAKGGFDPKAQVDVSQKQYNGQQYYSNINGGLKVPTWFGLEFGAGYETNDGKYLNPENTTPEGGLLYAGASVTLGRGLFIDERRAQLKKAKLYQQISVAEQQILLNELVYESSLAYWNWFKSYNVLSVYIKAYELANERFLNVQSTANIGERSFIDTVEASIQVQNRLLALQQSEMEYLNAAALLSVYLWADGVVPLELKETTMPKTIDGVSGNGVSPKVSLYMDSVLFSHPKLLQSRFKIEQNEVDIRLKREQLKPTLNLKYNPITEPVGNSPLENFSINNYTWGLEFQMPIFLRKERGSLQLAKLKYQESQLVLSNTEAMIQYKLKASINQWETSKKQFELYTQTVQSYAQLLASEQTLFNAGESSLFMINSRESGYIKTQIKRIELLIENRKSELKTNYVLGRLGL